MAVTLKYKTDPVSGSAAVSLTIGSGSPSGVQANDVVLLFVESAAENVGAVTPTGFTLAGFADVGTSGSAGDGTRLTVWWRRHTVDAASYTVNLGDYGDHTVAFGQVFKGVNPTGNPVKFIEFFNTDKGVSDTTFSLTPTNVVTSPQTMIIAGVSIPVLESTSTVSKFVAPSTLSPAPIETGYLGGSPFQSAGTSINNDGFVAASYYTMPSPGTIGTFTADSSIGTAFGKYVGMVMAMEGIPRAYGRTVSITY